MKSRFGISASKKVIGEAYQKILRKINKPNSVTHGLLQKKFSDSPPADPVLACCLIQHIASAPDVLFKEIKMSTR